MDLRIATLRNVLDGLSRELPPPDTTEERRQRAAQMVQSNPQFDSLGRRQATRSSGISADASDGQQISAGSYANSLYGQAAGIVIAQAMRRPVMQSRPVLAESLMTYLDWPVEATIIESQPVISSGKLSAPFYDPTQSTPLIDAIVSWDFARANAIVDTQSQGLNKRGSDKNTAQHYLYSLIPSGPNQEVTQMAICALANKFVTRGVKQSPNAHGFKPIDYARAFNPELYQVLTRQGTRNFPFKD